ncbi:SPFH domain-containing protein [Cognatishimia sp.]|uniref:SPFH domain-containing protein n=1 Tax=Cognatishimia sp. TaxID=2211648 RepID=UPI003512C012|nr:hypothetical protein [Cognatishimia sp.]
MEITISLLIITVVGVFALVSVATAFRRVVNTNMVHIVQEKKQTTVYGKDTENGNVYYDWPSWVPVIGVTKTVMPVSVFDISLNNYEAYDKGRLPFVIDIKAFFRVSDANTAAQRVSNFNELEKHLAAVLQGSARTLLAKSDIETIMEDRASFGDSFTEEVSEQLKSWGVKTVKNIELMDIRDTGDSHVISNIMKKKKSFIEMESRVEVAKNKQQASVAEIEADKEVKFQQEAADQVVGLRKVENQREVSLANEEAVQAVADQSKITTEKEMAVKRVQEVERSRIDKDVQIVQAEQEKEKSIIIAKGNKEQTILVADGKKEAKLLEAQGIEAEGNARASAEKEMQRAPVEAKIELAKEIGSNTGYQQYLIEVRKVEASEAVGIEQAKALQDAEIKVITNSNSPNSGLDNVMDLFSSKGGTQVGAMLEGLSNTETGQKVLDHLNKDKKKK